MCLRDIKEDLVNSEYSNPLEFDKDIKTMFENSRIYNPNTNTEVSNTFI